MTKYRPTGGIAGKPLEKEILKYFWEIRSPGERRGCMVFDHQLHSESQLGGRGGTLDVQLLLKTRCMCALLLWGFSG